MVDELSKKIWNNKKFRSEYINLINAANRVELNLNKKNNNMDDEAYVRLIKSVLIFSSCENEYFRKIAYIMGVALLTVIDSKHSSFSSIVELVKLAFSRLGNFVAIDLINLKNKDNIIDAPKMIWFEEKSYELNNTINIFNEQLKLTNFQYKLWELLNSEKSISISAPTSSGKSYILKMYLLLIASKFDNKSYIYIVPTRALITQVTQDLIEFIKKYNLKNINIRTVPSIEEISGSTIYILTPERARVLYNDNEISFEMAIIDEAQSIEDLERGLILQDVIEELLLNNINLQLVFISPLISNPEILNNIFNIESGDFLVERESPVSQNIIGVLSTNDSLKFEVLIDDSFKYLGQLSVEDISTDKHKKIATIAKTLGKEDQNIIYTTGPAKCEEICKALMDIDENQDSDNDLIELANFIEEYIHKDYLLAKCIRSGVAYHYSRIPSVIRRNIEKFYEEKKIKYIVCTSTLLYGVNLPAKNLFILEPYKDNIELTRAEFWNLIGRAGRLKKDLCGNIFLIDFYKEENIYLKSDKNSAIEPSIIRNITDNYDSLKMFIENDMNPSGKDVKLENTFMKLYKYYSKGILSERLREFNSVCNDIENKLTDVQMAEIYKLMESVNKMITIPNDVILKNISISPYRQQQMYEYILKKINDGKVKDVLPIHPLDDYKKVYGNLLRLLKRIHNCFEMKAKKDNSHKYFATLALKWMRGEHFSVLISGAIKENTSKSIDSIIRNVMRNIDDDLRFRYVKYISCYIDLLIEALKSTNNIEIIKSIPNIPLYIEIGASEQTMITFIELGLSRTSSKILMDISGDRLMDRKKALKFIKEFDFVNANISKITRMEVLSLDF